ncbi:sugar ABC transporter permease [Pseudoclostridium thermosuccinogenes]|uniref:carbohydrate ABC transporter permease n=1 Tax=Clostridium thermosuccinogenes TaxID=84032 RepID=UPI002FD8ACAE
MKEISVKTIKKKRRRLSMEQKRDLKGWIFVSPFVLGFLVLFVWIFIDSFRFSFMNVQLQSQGGYTTTFIGWKNYLKMLTIDPDFNRQLIGSVQDMLLDTPIIVMFSLFIAVVLNQKMKGRTFFRAVFFIPVILATGIIERADMSNSIMNAYQNIQGIDTGMAQLHEATTELFSRRELVFYMQRIFDFSPTLMNMTVGAASNIYSVVNNSGVQILIFLAGLQAISPSIYEAAYMEGCSGWECFWKITFPMISPLILVNVIYSIVDSFTGSSNQVMNSITASMRGGQYGEAAAKAWMYFLVAAVFITLISFVVSRFVFYQNKE